MKQILLKKTIVAWCDLSTQFGYSAKVLRNEVDLPVFLDADGSSVPDDEQKADFLCGALEARPPSRIDP